MGFEQSDISSQDNESISDLTGRDRLTRNVLASWAGHFVFIVAGFIMPRTIDRQIGQDALGIWDFAWSLVAYFGLVQGGIGSSVNRYVAKYRAIGDIDNVNRVVSSVTCILIIAALIVLALTFLFTLTLPEIWGVRLADRVTEAQWVVFLLGTSLATRMIFSGFNGVITGCHRWDWYNGINAGWYAIIVGAMIASLLLGAGLRGLALVYLCGAVLTCLSYVLAAFRFCHGLRVRFKFAHWSTAKQMLTFGGKTILPTIANLLLNQTISILVISFLGPASLALYSRPLSLVRHVRTLLEKFSYVLTPTVSSIQNIKDGNDQLQGLLIKATRYAAYISIPMVLMLTIMSTPILLLWMGPHYAFGNILTILAAGSFLPLIFTPATCILAGLNAHGRPGLSNFVASIAAVVFTLLALGPLQFGLVGVAASVAFSLTFFYSLYLIIYVSRTVGIPVRKYIWESLRGPGLFAIPMIFCLVSARIIFPKEPLFSLLWAGVASIVVLAIPYWRYAIPQSMKSKLITWFGLKRFYNAEKFT